MALDVDECQQMIDACDAAGVYLSLAKIRAGSRRSTRGHDLVGHGTAGEPMASTPIGSSPAIPTRAGRSTRARAGRGSTGGATAATSFAGSPGEAERVIAARFAWRRTDMQDLTGMATYEFPGGLLASLAIWYASPGTTAAERAHYTIIGTKAVVDIHAYGGVDMLPSTPAKPSIATSSSRTRTRPGTSTRHTSGAGSRRRSRTSSRPSGTADRPRSTATTG